MRRLLLIALFLLMPALPAAAQQFTCTCETSGETGCPAQSAIQSDAPVPDATDLPTASAKCQTACKALLGDCYGGATTSAPACPPGTVCLVNPLKTASVPELVGNVIKAAVGVVGAFALLIFVYGGFLWLTSGGEAAKIQAGKDAMKWTAIGLAVVFSSYALVSFVLSTLTNVG